MKKSVCIWLILVLVAVISLPVAFASVDSQREGVVITEEVLSGNPEAAEGVTLQFLTRWDAHALWDTRYKVGTGETVTDFDFVEDGVNWPEAGSEEVRLEVTTNFGTAVGVGAIEQPEVYLDDMWLPEIIQDVASRTKIGETHTEIVRMADYYQYYPIELEAMCEALDMSFYSYRQTAYWEEFFHVQVSPEEMLKVSITKDGEEGVVAVDCNDIEGGRSIDFETAYAFGENGCFFTYACTDWERGERVALGENTGIFYAPYVTENRRLTFEDTLVKKVCEIPGDIVPAQMLWDEKKGEMYLAARTVGEYRLYVYDVQDGGAVTLRQELTVLAGEELPYWREMSLEEGGIFLKWSDGSFSFVAESNGDYLLWCSDVFVPNAEWQEDIVYPENTPVEVMLKYEEGIFSYEHAIAFDGERLVLASYEVRESVNVTLAVYGRDELLYCGKYHHSGEVDRYLSGMGESEWIYAQGMVDWGKHMMQMDFTALNVTIK